MIKNALRRPLLSTGTAVAVLAATAAGYATVDNQTTGAAYTAAGQTPPAASPAQLADNPGFEAAKAAGTRARTLTAARSAAAAEAAAAARVVRARQAAAAAAAAARAAAQARRAEAEARQAAAARAARDQARTQILGRAQSDPRSVARLMLASRGWSSQFGCLDSLWTKESNWNYQASNASSGAYGIPQALPGSKMGTVAADWRTNPVTQITWGLNYIASTYGTPCAAWSHSQAMNWY